MKLNAIRLPLPWQRLGFPHPWHPGPTVYEGSPGWAWTDRVPALGVEVIENVPEPAGDEREGWAIDRVVLVVPDLESTVSDLQGAGCDLRLRSSVRGRAMAFFRVGPVLEVVEVAEAPAALYGIALVTDRPLDLVAGRWRELGFDVGEPHPAVQPNRLIFSVRDLECGLAVMSPDGARQGASP